MTNVSLSYICALFVLKLRFILNYTLSYYRCMQKMSFEADHHCSETLVVNEIMLMKLRFVKYKFILYVENY